MSTHDAHAMSREEVLVGIDRPTLPLLKTISLVLAGIGLIVFIVGLFLQPDRTWQSLLVSWLYFTSISSAGVMFVAVQRITTARWSRPSFASSRDTSPSCRSRSCFSFSSFSSGNTTSSGG